MGRDLAVSTEPMSVDKHGEGFGQCNCVADRERVVKVAGGTNGCGVGSAVGAGTAVGSGTAVGLGALVGSEVGSAAVGWGTVAASSAADS